MNADDAERFRQLVLPHLDAAFNLARWLVRTDADAEDLVQESYVRAWRGFDGFRGTDARPWVLAIVRNACSTWLASRRAGALADPLDEAAHADDAVPDPESAAVASDNVRALRSALGSLAPRHREMIVLRELEGLSYREIATVTGLPIGTVMSSLARARAALRERLAPAGGGSR